jgi:hypothetical protein
MISDNAVLKMDMNTYLGCISIYSTLRHFILKSIHILRAAMFMAEGATAVHWQITVLPPLSEKLLEDSLKQIVFLPICAAEMDISLLPVSTDKS